MSTSLLFCKSQVLVRLSGSSKDQKSGVLLISKDEQQVAHDAMVAWIAVDEMSAQEAEQLLKGEMKLAQDSQARVKIPKEVVVQAMYGTWSFAVKLGYIRSIQMMPPDPNGWYQGSLSISSRNQNEEIPVLFLADDKCPSTRERSRQLIDTFQPFQSATGVYWGGVDFKAAVERLAQLTVAPLDQTVFLLNATEEDLRQYTGRPAGSGVGSDGTAPVGDIINGWTWSALASLASATTKATSFVEGLVRKHPLVQLAERNSSNPYVRQMLENPRVQEVQREYDSAKIYLARWSLGVKEQAEKYRKSNEHYRRLLAKEFNSDGDIEISEDELNTAMERTHPLSKAEWDSLFDGMGRLSLSAQEIKERIFHGGIKDNQLRRRVWPFLLGVFPWDSTQVDRERIERDLREKYEKEYKNRWLSRETSPNQEEEAYWQDQLCRIEKDVKRNDRHLALYKYNTPDAKPPAQASQESDSQCNEQSVTEESGENDDWEIKNPHLLILRNILISYNLHNDNLGYVQGMTDLLSPLYAILEDEAMSFWCFVMFMDRMERNFLRDQSGIRDQMLTLSELCQYMLPKFSAHLQQCESSNFFFCFRMLLVWFKREFEFADICTIWEILWTDYYSSQFQLFFLLAILQKNSRPVMAHLTQFDEILKYFNDLKCVMDCNDLLIRAELLFVHFKRSIDMFERTTSHIPPSNNSTATGFRRRPSVERDASADVISDSLRAVLSTRLIIKRESERTKDSIK
ncbi:ABL179Cp [Eremothecium gossypii ATCC 10895]|uniref:GTPase-activating protein GYP7 n=1 Tax=Eremothecium gossypii (strain ATCC 10895 / CBS 109.51 / FGSC 9923 / NRRL Y-1056) TaxID=284811 RepID=Q75E49_EREGS|nr:ABL179Cp [Eremothecium gossypii ATCC 10895]AAS50592.2 ABL179Cp [Eremothecium gossypii ATCC 10895]